MQHGFTKVHKKSTYIFVGRVDKKLVVTGIERSFGYGCAHNFCGN
jgi:hypothetical protein